MLVNVDDLYKAISSVQVRNDGFAWRRILVIKMGKMNNFYEYLRVKTILVEG